MLPKGALKQKKHTSIDPKKVQLRNVNSVSESEEFVTGVVDSSFCLSFNALIRTITRIALARLQKLFFPPNIEAVHLWMKERREKKKIYELGLAQLSHIPGRTRGAK